MNQKKNTDETIGETIATLKLVRAPLAVDDERVWKQERELELRSRLGAARASVPELLRWSVFGAPELRTRVSVPKAIDKLAALDLVGILTLLGPAGVGKSSLAAAKLQQTISAATIDAPDDVVLRARRARFISAPELAEAVFTRRLGAPEPPLLRDALNASLLVLDDLGVESASEPSNAAMREVIHTRHARRRPTVITTGFGLAAIGERYGAGIERRLGELVYDLGKGTRRGLEVVR